MRKIIILIVFNFFSVFLFGQTSLTKLNNACKKFSKSTPQDSNAVYWEYASELDSALFDYLKVAEINTSYFKDESAILEIKSLTKDSSNNHKFKFVSFEVSDNDRNGAVSDHLFVQWKINHDVYKVSCLSNVGHLEEIYLLNNTTFLIITSGLYSSKASVLSLKNNKFTPVNIFPKRNFDSLIKEKETSCENLSIDTNNVYCSNCKLSYSPTTKKLKILAESPYECLIRLNENQEGILSFTWTGKEFTLTK